MKICGWIVLSLLAMATVLLAAPRTASLVPRPVKVEWLSGSFRLMPQSRIVYSDKVARQEAETLAGELRPATGFELKTVSGSARKGDITLRCTAALAEQLGKEGYRLLVNADSVVIEAADGAGLFYGGQTLRQLFPPDIYAAIRKSVAWQARCCRITDRPRFAWRGYMLDYSRHFTGFDYTKHLLDAMAMNKLNVFHMHLTDDDGWRIEIKKYPKLTEIGAWRGTDCVIPNTRKGENFKRYGGYFTQEQIKDIVAYAARLHINVMPEIDLPGHCRAICTAYPATKPDPVPEDVKKVNAISPVKDANYRMIDDIVGEVARLFPFDYIHFGGDEVNHNLWKDDPQIKAFMKAKGIKNLHALQVYFTERLQKIAAAHGKKMIGWNEILNAALPRDTVIMSWTGTGPGFHAAKMGFPVVMAPGPYNYFDMAYVDARDEPPAHWWAGKIDCAKCYSFDPLAGQKSTASGMDKIMGEHGCLWTEFVVPWKSKSGWLKLASSGESADYKTFPRLCALAEVGWTPQGERKFGDFANRLGPEHLRRLLAMGVKLRVPLTKAVIHKGRIEIVPPYRGAVVRYTLDGSDPMNSPTAKTWDGKSMLDGAAGKLRLRTVLDGHISPLYVGARLERAGNWNTKGLPLGEFSMHSFDLTGMLDEPGVWRVGLRKSRGHGNLAVNSAEILVNGKVVASDAHPGSSAKKSKYKFVVKQSIASGAKVVLRLSMKPEGKDARKGARGYFTLEELK